MSDPSEVFFVIGSLQVGGAERHLCMVTRELAKRGNQITVYNFSGAGALGESMSDAGVRIIDPPIHSRIGKSKALNSVILAVSSIKLFLIFLFMRPKIVHFFLPQTYIIGAIMARCAGLSCLVMSRRSLNNYQQNHPLLGRLERRLHGSMTFVLGNSKRVVDQLHVDEGVATDKLGLIYNGVDLESQGACLDSDQKRRQLGIASSTLVLVIVANLIPYKGHSDLLQALSNIQTEMPGDWTLLVAGRDDGIGQSLERQAIDAGLGDKIRFLGARDDVPELLGISDLGVLCSHEEGFSNAILEAMAAGLAMVVTDVGGNAEAVRNEVTGLVVKAHSPAALGMAIMRLAGDAQLRKAMGGAAKERVHKQFSLTACVDQYEAFYDAVLSERKWVRDYPFSRLGD